MVERGIGRGLAAILPASTGDDETLHRIPLDLIAPNPQQPRRSFDEPELRELADSMRAHGVLQPILVRPLPGGRYELVAGERRWRAARLAELDRIPAVVRTAEESERLELALIENMAREDLNPVDAARACAALVDEFNLSKEEVGRRVGQEPRRDLEPDPPARAARRGAHDARVGPAVGGSRPRGAAGTRPSRAPPRRA